MDPVNPLRPARRGRSCTAGASSTPHRCWLPLALLAFPHLASTAAGPATSGEQPAVAATSAEWPMATGTWQNTRYSSLDEIDRTNAGRLKLAWTFSNGVFKGQEAAPVVVGSRMYVVSPFPNVLYAIDLARS